MSLFDNIQKAMGEDVMTTIYSKMNELFGAGNQLFAMEFPTRPLNPRDYEYPIDDCFSRVTKPYPVQEAEFLLSDALYDCYPIVQGPNGEKLSTVYNNIINNFVPRLESMASFVTDQKYLREWLLTPADTVAEDDTANLSRMELCKKLYNLYLEKKNEWNQKKESVYDGAKSGKGSNEAKGVTTLDDYTKWLSSQGLVEEELLNNFFNDAVVKGHYHEVLTLLGYLNVSSPAAMLETTKQKMRAGLRRSLDGSSDIYPVNFQPSNWFRSLAPNINPKDLTMAKEQLAVDFSMKQARLRNLQAQLMQLNAVHISPEDAKQMQTLVEDAEKALAKSESDMMKQYGASTYNVFKTVLNIYKIANPTAGAVAATGEELSKLARAEKLIDASAKDFTDDMVKSFEAVQNNLDNLKKLNDARMELSEAKVRDMTLQKQKIEEQIKNVQVDLDFLAPLVAGAIGIANSTAHQEAEKGLSTLIEAVTKAEKAHNEAINAVGGDEPNESQQNAINAAAETLEKANAELKKAQDELGGALISGDGGENDFTDVIISEKLEASSSQTSSSAKSSQSSWNVGGWFFSAGKSNSSSSAEMSATQKDAGFTLEIGFRAKKVSIDRGGWFNPNIFKLTQNFFRLSDTRVSAGIDKDQVQNASATGNATAINDLVTYTTKVGEKDVSVRDSLPAYPMGFVIAKDITIKITSSVFESESTKSEMASSSATSGGFLLFKGSSGTSSKSNSESSYSGFQGNSFYMRIPGPQVMGWFLQFTPPDVSVTYTHMDTDVYKNKAKEAQEALKALVNSDSESTGGVHE